MKRDLGYIYTWYKICPNSRTDRPVRHVILEIVCVGVDRNQLLEGREMDMAMKLTNVNTKSVNRVIAQN